MPFNGAGTYSPPGADFPVVTLTTVSSTHFNNTINDMSTGISNCLTKDGQNTWTANQPAGGFRITSLGAGVARTDSARLSDVQDGLSNWLVAGGTVDAITATYAPAVTALVDGQVLNFRASGANATTTPTFSPNGLTARTITKLGGTALVAGDISGNLVEVIVRYNLANTRWELLNPAIAPVIANTKIAAIGFIFDGGGAALTTGVKGDLVIPFACTINSVTLQADQSGSIVIDIWKKTYTLDSPPAVGQTITAAALPTLATHQSSQDTTLTGWTTAVAVNDMLRFNINSITTCTRVTLTLKVTKT